MPTTKEEDCLEAEPPRPSALLKLAENQALQCTRFLREYQEKLRYVGGEASVEDALQLANLVVALAARGRKSDAARAIEIESSVEIYLDLLATEIDNLLAKTR